MNLFFYLKKCILIIIRKRVNIIVQNKKYKQTRFLNIEKSFKINDFRAFLQKM